MKVSEFENGMFGIMDNGKMFVVVGECLVYHTGGFDYISSMKPDFSYTNYRVDRLYRPGAVLSFDGLIQAIKENFTAPVYICEKCVEMTVSEIENKLGIKNLKIIAEG